MSEIVWLASYPKSGNTWLRLFLANYAYNKKVKINDLMFTQFGLSDSMPAIWYAAIGLKEPTKEQQLKYRLTVQKHIANNSGPTPFVKTHCFLGSVNEYPLINTSITAGAVYIIRDPRDVAVSCQRYFKTINSADAAVDMLCEKNQCVWDGKLIQFVGDWSHHVNSWTRAKAVNTFRYEDMLSEPEKTFSAILKCLGQVPDQKRLRKALKNTNLKELRKQESREKFQENLGADARFFGTGGSKWKKHLTPEQVLKIEKTHHEVMARFNYPLSIFRPAETEQTPLSETK